MSNGQASAGWYPDPAGDTSKIRYWDGQAWTDQTQPMAQASQQAGVVAVPEIPQPGYPPEQVMPSNVAQPYMAQPYSAQPYVAQPYMAQPYMTQPYMAQPGMGQQTKDKKGFAIAGFVLGLASVIFFCLQYLDTPLGILAVIFGCLGLKSSKKGMAIAGIILGVIGIIASIVFLFIMLDVLADPTKYGFAPDYFDSILGR